MRSLSEPACLLSSLKTRNSTHIRSLESAMCTVSCMASWCGFTRREASRQTPSSSHERCGGIGTSERPLTRSQIQQYLSKVFSPSWGLACVQMHYVASIGGSGMRRSCEHSTALMSYWPDCTSDGVKKFFLALDCIRSAEYMQSHQLLFIKPAQALGRHICRPFRAIEMPIRLPPSSRRLTHCKQ